jgi:glutaminyl-peptide cyclotransferase
MDSGLARVGHLALGIVVLMGTLGFLPPPRRAAPDAQSTAAAPTWVYQVVRSYPHDRGAFTQGLIFRNGAFYEGTGLNGRSGLRKVQLETGEVLQMKPLGQEYFGEGITDWKGSILQITWQSEVGFVYDMNTFEQTRTWTYKGEGWGLTHDDTHIIMSDGSSSLRFIDPATLKETSRITVRDGGNPVERLNELEYVKGEVFANVWQTDRIARISPKDGKVTGWIDLTGLLSLAERGTPDAVLNGIAYDSAGDRLFVTGKLWPRVFEIKLVKR